VDGIACMQCAAPASQTQLGECVHHATPPCCPAGAPATAAAGTGSDSGSAWCSTFRCDRYNDITLAASILAQSRLVWAHHAALDGGDGASSEVVEGASRDGHQHILASCHVHPLPAWRLHLHRQHGLAITQPSCTVATTGQHSGDGSAQVTQRLLARDKSRRHASTTGNLTGTQ
jgi:hypothetical protein